MSALLLLVLTLVSNARAATVPDPCKPPFGSVVDCPDKYLPHGVATPPSTTDKVAIQSLIVIGNTALKDEELKRTKWALAKVEVEKQQDLTTAYALAAIGDFQKKATELRDAKLVTQKAYDAAIVETTRIYRLTPPVTDFSQDRSIGENLRRRAPWAPRFSEEEFRDPKTGVMRQRNTKERDAIEAELASRAAALGLTSRPHLAAAVTDRETGQMRVFLDSFQNPDQLAALIYHESTHWVDMMATGGKAHSPEEKYRLEARAYARQAQLYAILGLTAESTNATAIADQYHRQEVEAKEKNVTPDQLITDPVYSRWLQGSTPSGPADASRPESVKADGDTRFLDDLERLRGVSDEARTTARRLYETAQTEREAREKLEHAAFMKRLAAEEEARRAAYKYIKTAAGLACSDPQAFAAQARGGAVISAWVDELYFSSYLSEDVNEVGWKSLGVKPNDCQRDVMNKIIYARAPAGPYEIAGWALAYRNAHPSLLKRFATSVGEFFESKGGYETERVRADSSPSPRREPEQRSEPPQRTEPEERRSSGSGYREGEAVRQARGIDATKVWRN